LPQNTISANSENVHAQIATDVQVLSERERHQILYEWNDTHVEFPDACVHELFEWQVARDPDAVAVVFKDRQLSYQQLNQCANQVAHSLRKRGVGPEVLVGVCLECSPEMVIALLGVWKAGGAYVPLDPAYPQARLSFMTNDAGVKMLLTNEKCKHLFPSSSDRVVCLDSDWPAIARESTSNLAAATVPSNLAYVMYTSGSTGQPKGALIQHNGLVNYLCWAVQMYGLKAGGSVPVHSSIAFDTTVLSLYAPLLAGAQIELLPGGSDVQSLLMALRQKSGRSLIAVTPAHFQMLCLQMSPEEMAGINNFLVICGEKLMAESLTRWREIAPATRIVNEYGPTETVVGCCAYEVQPDDPLYGSVPIGRPIANTQLYVLDPDFRPVPPGTTGELYIGGAGVGRGYLNRPKLTRERFLADPFSGWSGARLYKTGDLVRYRKDGALEFLGRVDDQVKVRGYRIELGEIETRLAGHPGVQTCVVLAREDTPGNKQLVGYVVARENESLEAGGLQDFLEQRLPAYMVPTHFVFLDSFPLTQNGKIDRTTFPPPSYENALTSQKFVAPRTETETKLAAIWMELLNLERIGIHDDFFELGGDSLLAIRALSQIQEVFGEVLSMQTLYTTATIASQAKALTGPEEYRDRLAYAVPVQTKGMAPPFFWIGAADQASSLSVQLGPNQPIFAIGIEPRAADQLQAPYRAEELAKHLVLALREKQPQGPYWLGGFCRDGVFAYEVAQQLTSQGQDVGLLVMCEPLNPYRSVRDRFATGLRRTFILLDFRLNELLRLKIPGIPLYARSRWKGLKCRLTLTSWRMANHFPVLKTRSDPPDLERILYLAARYYKPEPLRCPIVILGCKDLPILAAGDPFFGWREWIAGECETHEIPGDHVGIFSESNVAVLADPLRARLNDGRPRDRNTQKAVV
jgi:amino acid adenylation domain-containing protein